VVPVNEFAQEANSSRSCAAKNENLVASHACLLPSRSIAPCSSDEGEVGSLFIISRIRDIYSAEQKVVQYRIGAESRGTKGTNVLPDPKERSLGYMIVRVPMSEAPNFSW
jgi:hypothetical protein